ncbi:carboxypeptidase-like regulatory domain-containing protein [Maribacter sp. IgM3_T14_3]|uniref:carboxypeptidase-like regulatory domain-containing protein n=1 Tax=Maribacter sp. IgM3_T14_3 TaxID=3415140 RepID=UPI003C70538B
MSKKKSTLLVLLLIPLLFFGQKKDFIEGILLDLKTKEPVVFATIKLRDNAKGVISNLNGGFKIPKEYQTQGNYLEISSMGYETKVIETALLKVDSTNIINMRPATFQLNEVVLKSGSLKRLTAKQIIRKALDRIPENYPIDSFSLIGYYRDYQIQKNKYLNFNEAIVQIYDKGFQSDHFKETEYSLLSYVKNDDFKIDSFAAKPYDYMTKDKFVPNVLLLSRYRGNELVNLCIHNAIRNYDKQGYSFIGVFNKDFIGAHRFSSVENTYYDGEPVYKIGIKKKLNPFTVKGDIYIDKDDYAIRKLVYSLYGKRPKNSLYPVDLVGTKDNNELLYEVLVEYSKVNGRMYLNYISLHNKFVLRRHPVFKIENLLLNIEEGIIEVELNSEGANYEELELADFELKFNGQDLQIEKLVDAFDNKIILKLSSGKAQISLRKNLFSTVSDPKQLRFLLRIQNLRDEYGNTLEEPNYENLHQFREFFTQTTITQPNINSIEKDLMQKRKPLNHVDQPISKLSNMNEYWMNTPLQIIRE